MEVIATSTRVGILAFSLKADLSCLEGKQKLCEYPPSPPSKPKRPVLPCRKQDPLNWRRASIAITADYALDESQFVRRPAT